MNLYSNTKTVTKPWGKEVWLHLDDKYCYKRIYINAGYKTSYQYHLQKSETNFIVEGKAEVWLEDDNGVVQKYQMEAGDYFTVTPPKKHRVIALTDIILQEVSTPHVDDVIRINDEFHRSDGKIEDEHKVPAFVILAAGKGERVKSVTRGLHKGLLKVGDQAAISHIIDKVPADFEIVVTLGYNGELVKDYCTAAHPNRKFVWVEVSDYESPESGPGKSILAAKDKLNRPFYFCTVDCLFDKLPPMYGNWIGVSDTDLPEIYSTALVVDESNMVMDFKNKSKDGYDKAFAGLAFIRDHELFWESLAGNKEIVYAFENRKFALYAEPIVWFDIGTIDGYSKVGKISQKNIAEETYTIFTNFFKINADKKITENRGLRAEYLGDLVPPNIKVNGHVLSYETVKGHTLYEWDNAEDYKRLIDFVFSNINNGLRFVPENKEELCRIFYIEKTSKRLSEYFKKYPEKERLELNEKDFIDKAIFYQLFHGDLQPDNVIVDGGNFYYIDWRPDFAGETQGGDIYYDLGKLYGGLSFNYREAKDLSVFKYNTVPQSDTMKEALEYFEKQIIKNGFDLDHIKRMTGLIWLNMSPIHHSPMDKVLFREGKALLNEV